MAPRVGWLGLTSGILTLGTNALYLFVIWREGDPSMGRVAFVATTIAALGVIVLVGWHQRRPTMLVAAAGGLMVLGVLGIFSIGLILLVAAILALLAAMLDHGSVSIPAVLLRFLASLLAFAAVATVGVSLT